MIHQLRASTWWDEGGRPGEVEGLKQGWQRAVVPRRMRALACEQHRWPLSPDGLSHASSIRGRTCHTWSAIPPACHTHTPPLLECIAPRCCNACSQGPMTCVIHWPYCAQGQDCQMPRLSDDGAHAYAHKPCQMHALLTNHLPRAAVKGHGIEVAWPAGRVQVQVPTGLTRERAGRPCLQDMRASDSASSLLLWLAAAAGLADLVGHQERKRASTHALTLESRKK